MQRSAGKKPFLEYVDALLESSHKQLETSEGDETFRLQGEARLCRRLKKTLSKDENT
jgi:hypothetical protein